MPRNTRGKNGQMAEDGKLRIPFTVVYKSGKIRRGTMYAQGNIMMSDYELIARLDQLWSNEVVGILFPPEPKDYQQSDESERKSQMKSSEFYQLVEMERERQRSLWGDQSHPDYTWLAILMEEVGEAVKCLNENQNPQDELIQIAAVVEAWVTQPES